MTSTPKRTLIWTALVPALLLLSACAMGPDYERPTPEVPETYRTETVPAEYVVNLRWWELFKDPVLYKLVTAALENNRDVKVAAARIEEARAALGFTRADQYPRFDIDAGASTGNFTGRTRSDDEVTNLYIAPTASWEIDFWGKYRRSTEAARAELMATEYALKTVQLSLVSEVVATYYQLLDFYQRLTISESTLQSRLKSLDIIQQRFDKGIIPEIDLNQAQIQKEIAAGAIPLYRRQIALTENALSILLGRLPASVDIGEGLVDQPLPPGIPMGLPSEILQRRPDVAQAEALLHAQTARIGVAVAARFPAVSLTGILGVASTEVGSITSDGGVWFIGGSLLGPIFDFGKSAQRVAVEEARTRQAMFQYENAVLTAFREVEDALVEIETYKEQMASVKRRLEAARNANELSNERYDKGVTSYLEVLEADRSLFSVELEFSEVDQQLFRSYVRLYKALGGGWLTREERASSDATR
jgi:multidrug efflux system outer membrane protein